MLRHLEKTDAEAALILVTAYKQDRMANSLTNFLLNTLLAIFPFPEKVSTTNR
jgi:hypothetical protein